MVSDVDVLGGLVEMLKNNYIIENTDGIIPLIGKGFTNPTNKIPNPNEDFIFVYSVLASNNTTGIGQNTVSEVRENVKVEIRSRPSNDFQEKKVNDNHIRKVLNEIKRIFFSNIEYPNSDFDAINPKITQTDLSENSRGIFRFVLELELVKFCRNMT